MSALSRGEIRGTRKHADVPAGQIPSQGWF